ncbi:spartin [Anaeramoeba ignava]|uniref:Spartin n=1 Tax=Anaeramoeba ignava TaxID=1746090 RepID=A0A9Q0R8G0_ANAIG|nr:spartin [Anaeramoeba ignava]
MQNQKQTQQTINATLIFEIDNVIVRKINDNSKQILTQGKLQILKALYEQHEIMLLKINEIVSPLLKTKSFMKVAPLSYAFPLNENEFAGILLPKNIDEDSVDLFETFLYELTEFWSVDDEDENEDQETNQNPKEETKKPETKTKHRKKHTKPTKDSESDEDQVYYEDYLNQLEEEKMVEEFQTEKPSQITSNQEIKKEDQLEFDESIHPMGPIIGNKIRKGGAFVSKMLVSGAKKGGNLIRKGGEKLTTKIKKNEKEWKPSEKTKQRMETTKAISGGIVEVSTLLLKGAVETARYAGKGANTLIKKTNVGQKLKENTSGPKMKAVKEIGISTIDAGLNIFDGIIQSGKEIVKSTSDSVSTVVGHKYGEEAANFSRRGGEVAQDVTQTVGNLSSLTKRGIATAVVKESYKEKQEEEKQEKEEEEKKEK